MSYHGDIRLGDTIDIKFCTATTTGAPTQLAGTPVISAYPGNSTTQITAGITLTVDFDTVTGLNNVRVVASGANGYATATNYALVITTGTVGGTSAVGYVVGTFSIENRSAVMPTTAARTLDVSATGEAGIDWANVGSPTTSVSLSGTTVATVTTTTTATNLTNNNDKTGYSLTAATGLGNQTANITGNLSGSVGSVTGAVGSVTGAVGSVAGNVDGNVTGTVAGVTPSTAAQVAAILTTQITESYRANAAAPTLAQFMCEVLAHLGESAISGTTKTINKLDHVTGAATFTLDDATTPSSITRAT